MDKKRKDRLKDKSSAFIVKLLDGDFFHNLFAEFTMVISLLILLSLISMVYSYHADQVLSDIDKVQTRISILRLQAVDAESKLMRIRRPSSLLEKINEDGVELSMPDEVPGAIYVEPLDN